MTIFCGKRIKNIICIMITILIMVTNLCSEKVLAEKLEVSSLYSSSCAVVDGGNGRLLIGKKENEPMANASTTKILTCIIALEKGKLNDSVKPSVKAVKQPEVRLGLKKDREYKLIDLLYAMMLESYNDCAYAIAEHIGGSIESFAKIMNDKAIRIGCENTWFYTPNGLDYEKNNNFHHTTATDLCRIMKYCCWDSEKSELFLEITGCKNYTFTNGGRKYTVTNHNQLLAEDGYISGKTGYTAKAGYCYVAAWEKDGKKIVVSLLGCGWPNHKNYKWRDTRKLVGYIDKAYNLVSLEESELLIEQDIYNGRIKGATLDDFGKIVKLKMETKGENPRDKSCLLKEGEKIEREVKFVENKVPILKGKGNGWLTYKISGVDIEKIELYASDTIGKWRFIDFFKLILAQFF